MQALSRRPTSPGRFESASPVCEVALLTSSGGLTLEVKGTLDASTLPALSAQLDQLQCTPCDNTILDLQAVEVLDHVACNAIAGLSHYVAARGGDLVIRCVPGAIRGILVSVGLGDRLERRVGLIDPAASHLRR